MGRDPESKIVNEIQSFYPNIVAEGQVQRKGRVRLSVGKDHVAKIVSYLKGRFGFDHVVSLTGADDPKADVFRVIYHILSTSTKVLLTLETQVSRSDATLPSIIPILDGADWHERETHEMLGITFKGNPNLGRVLLPEDWKGGFPLRKDFKLGK